MCSGTGSKTSNKSVKNKRTTQFRTTGPDVHVVATNFHDEIVRVGSFGGAFNFGLGGLGRCFPHGNVFTDGPCQIETQIEKEKTWIVLVVGCNK